jgi:hypothetical protein
MKKLLWIIPILFLFSFQTQAQGQRYGDSSPVLSSPTPGGPIYSVANAGISFCSHPANAVPCTNKVTTYTDITLTTPCSTSTQLTLIGSSTCVGKADGYGNWGVNVPTGTYDYTVQLASGGYIGPYVVTVTSGGGGGVQSW